MQLKAMSTRFVFYCYEMLASVNDTVINGVSGRTYKVLEFIASGGFGSVFRVKYGNKEYICKTE